MLELNKYSWNLFIESPEAKILLKLEPFRSGNLSSLKAYNKWVKLICE